LATRHSPVSLNHAMPFRSRRRARVKTSWRNLPNAALNLSFKLRANSQRVLTRALTAEAFFLTSLLPAFLIQSSEPRPRASSGRPSSRKNHHLILTRLPSGNLPRISKSRLTEGHEAELADCESDGRDGADVDQRFSTTEHTEFHGTGRSGRGGRVGLGPELMRAAAEALRAIFVPVEC
jgi:hypothetical protein